VLKNEVLSSPFQDEDKHGFECIIRRYYPTVYHHLQYRLKDRNKAEDFTQETFLKLYRQMKERQMPGNLRGWLFIVANNLCRDYWRSSGYRKETHGFDQIPELKDRKGQVVETLVRKETCKEVVSLLSELPENQRKIITLRFYNNLKLKEIAEELACPVGTVKSRLFHALRFLKNRIEEKGM
jgi:RNA polymerase sigma-70 factor (ECF subfamily)